MRRLGEVAAHRVFTAVIIYADVVRFEGVVGGGAEALVLENEILRMALLVPNANVALRIERRLRFFLSGRGVGADASTGGCSNWDGDGADDAGSSEQNDRETHPSL